MFNREESVVVSEDLSSDRYSPTVSASFARILLRRVHAAEHNSSAHCNLIRSPWEIVSYYNLYLFVFYFVFYFSCRRWSYCEREECLQWRS